VAPINGSLIANATSPFIQTGLTNGTTYFYVVAAVNSYGESAASTRVTCTPAHSLPTDITATPGNASVTLDWTSLPGATSYNIYWSAAPGLAPGNGSQMAGVTTAPYTHSPLNNGTTYYYVVTAVFATGESAPSTQVSARPSTKPAPAEPIGVTVTPGNGQVTISWTSVSGATSYNIYWATFTGVTPLNSFLKAGVTNPYTQKGLNNGSNYYYVVTAVNGNGESTASTQVSVAPSKVI
jgi:fibronectin type 3 domain-containing protein